MITRADIVVSLRSMGLERGDHLIVHSSLRKVGQIKGGAAALIDALLEVVGPEGNCFFPTFTNPVTEEPFDPATTPSENGAVCEAARVRPEAVRSLHPTHAIAVIGPRAPEVCAGHLEHRAVGKGSPLDELYRMGGKVLLVGVSHTSNTMIHLGEEYAGVAKSSYWDPLPLMRVRTPGGILEHPLDTSTSCSVAFDTVELPLRANGQITDGRVGSALCRMMRAADVVDRVVELLGERPDALLCSYPNCRPCTTTRGKLRGHT